MISIIALNHNHTKTHRVRVGLLQSAVRSVSMEGAPGVLTLAQGDGDKT
jgi:hypothetical protein